MKCPKCDSSRSIVIETRPALSTTIKLTKHLEIKVKAASIRRRRWCEDCQHKYTTYEISADAFVNNGEDDD